jgi:serine protease Do
MKASAARAGMYVLLFALGGSVGLIAGGEWIRALYGVNAGFSLFGGKRQGPAAGTAADAGQPFRRAAAADALSMCRENSLVYATRDVAPCVVGIVVTQIQVVRNPYYTDDFFDFFFGPDLLPRYRQIESIGSGFVIRADGMILTNYHVIQNAAKLYVNFPDGRRIEGKIVGADERADIAVISVSSGKFSTVKFGDSDQAMIGEWAIAIGNPFLNFMNDAHPTVTAGVVSALNRNFTPAEGVYYQDMLQTDAAINPGNSGGPLVNAAGEVIGVNTFIYTGSANNKGSIGIGFAIPINRARRVADELIRYGRRRDVWTGIAVQNFDSTLAQALGSDRTEGVVVVSVEPKSPGAIAGVARGDIIAELGRRRIQSHKDIDGFFLDYFAGDTVRMNIVRKGKNLVLPLILKEAPAR